MRSHGWVEEVPHAGTTDHVCWVYAGDGDLDAAVGRFLDDGLALGERLLGVGECVIDSLGRESARHGGNDALAARGVLETLTLAQVHDATRDFLPDREMAFYDAATRRALADGFTGLRVVAEVSALAADPARRPELVRWEHLADDYIAHAAGFTAMCAYRADLGRDTLADVSSVHPLVHSPEGVPAFQVFFDEDRVVLTGSVDTFGAARLAAVLAGFPAHRAHTLLDVGLLEFVDVAGVRVLSRWARDLESRGGRLELTGASPLLRRIWKILALHGLAPVTFVGVPA